MEQTTPSHHIGKLSIGDVIKSSLKIYFNNFWFFIFLFIISSLIAIAIYCFLDLIRFQYSTDVSVYCLFAWFLVLSLMHSISVYVVSMQLNGQLFCIRHIIKHGKGRLALAFVTSSLLYIGNFILYVVVVALNSNARFIVIIVILKFTFDSFVSVPALIIEKIGPIEAVKRSKILIGDYFLEIFGILYILCSIPVFIYFVIGTLSFPADLNYIYYQPLYCILSICTAYTYHILSIEKNGSQIDEITNSPSETT